MLLNLGQKQIFFLKKILFVYLWLPWVFTASHNRSLVAVSRGYSLVAACDLLIEVASLVAEHGLSSPQALVVAQGLSSCSLWDSRAQAH